jgi:hypothetical protein
MWHVGRDAQHFPGRDRDFPVVNKEAQCALDDVADLLVVMTVQRYLRTLLKQETRNHHVAPYDKLPANERG